MKPADLFWIALILVALVGVMIVAKRMLSGSDRWMNW